MKRIFLIPFFLLYIHVLAQEHPEPGDPNSLKELFTRGEVEGHIRNFFMTTLNEGSLKDYYTNAIGGALAYKTREFKGFELGVKGIFTYKGFSTDLNEADETTGQISKWEHELYDITNFDNFNDLDRLEELYLRFNFEHGYLTYGKLAIEDTPLLNESDGRMKPFAFKGIWFQYQKGGQNLTLSWLDRVSPRSTVEWYDFNEAIGLVNNGFQPNGETADYRDKTESKGIALLQYENHISSLDLKANHWYLHHISYTSMLEVDLHYNDWTLGIQYAIQFPDRFQDGLPYIGRYVQPQEKGQVLSGKLAYGAEPWNFSLAYTRAFDTGRFLFPKELGRDHFFTSIPRSRLEGLGDVDVLTLSGTHRFKREGFYVGLDFTEVFGAKVGDFQFNKYNLDEYYQLNLRLHYELKGYLEGLNFDLLYIHKENRNNSGPEIIFNSSNFDQISFVTNYAF
ncbi:hypothetical protein SAMN06265375_101926 [Muriicola jejuensis]|uniref:Outer membrane porin, OprD family n=1 Tax=Muriicola jejuensis TaxID=504488 RepID=A0A6P0U8X7_9FLAO|nr:hypothetical protein [Muriicola jejuensis]NER09564.1 hypothetical protein [Muriicola jejuensis]SMP07748.1 hypothetical protein SAMN06265375_101926 [Muriicola jejuensis]